MIRRPPRSTRTGTLFPYTTLFRSSGQDSGHTKASSGWKNFRCLVGVSAHPLPIAPLCRRVGEVDHYPRLACDPMKAFEGSIDDVYQRLERDSSMPASIAAASRPYKLRLGHTGVVTRTTGLSGFHAEEGVRVAHE